MSLLGKPIEEVIETLYESIKNKRQIITNIKNEYNFDNDSFNDIKINRFKLIDLLDEFEVTISQSLQAIQTFKVEIYNLKEKQTTEEILNLTNEFQMKYNSNSNNNLNNNNNNILVVKSSLSNNVNNSSQYIHYSKNNMLIDCDYEPNIFSNNIESNLNNNKNKTLSKASSMKSFNNNIYYNLEMKKTYKNNSNNNAILRKQKTEKAIKNKLNGVISNNGWQNQNKYLIFKNN